MVYRVLGVVSLVIGGIFALVAVLVLLPFIDNFNTSLLVLCGVFGILAYVFLAMGWQLFHPPAERGGKSAEEVATMGAESASPQPAVHPPSERQPAGQPPSELRPAEHPRPVPVVPSIAADLPPTELESVPVAIPVGDAQGGVAGSAEAVVEETAAQSSGQRSSPNGGTADPAHPGPVRFRKPGAPVPHK